MPEHDPFVSEGSFAASICSGIISAISAQSAISVDSVCGTAACAATWTKSPKLKQSKVKARTNFTSPQ